MKTYWDVFIEENARTLLETDSQYLERFWLWLQTRSNQVKRQEELMSLHSDMKALVEAAQRVCIYRGSRTHIGAFFDGVLEDLHDALALPGVRVIAEGP